MPQIRYMQNRKVFKRAYVIIDARHGLKFNDKEFLARLEQSKTSFQVRLRAILCLDLFGFGMQNSGCGSCLCVYTSFALVHITPNILHGFVSSSYVLLGHT